MALVLESPADCPKKMEVAQTHFLGEEGEDSIGRVADTAVDTGREAQQAVDTGTAVTLVENSMEATQEADNSLALVQVEDCSPLEDPWVLLWEDSQEVAKGTALDTV